MVKKTYYEKLKDPRWQKKRLEAMQFKDFCCELCGDDQNTLNVHHKEYFKDLEPWEYELWQLSVLCESCHDSLHNDFDLLKWVCSHANLDGPNNRTEIAFLIAGYLNLDYEGILSISCLDNNKYFFKAYSAGKKASIFKES